MKSSGCLLVFGQAICSPVVLARSGAGQSAPSGRLAPGMIGLQGNIGSILTYAIRFAVVVATCSTSASVISGKIGSDKHLLAMLSA